MKSTLDYVSRLPRAIIGRSWTNARFGKNGKTVISALRNNLPDELSRHASPLETIINDHQGWLEMAIESRNRLNHCIKGGFPIESAMVVKTTINGDEIILVPMWLDNLTLRDYMGSVWHNLMCLVELLTMGFLYMRFKPEWGFIYNSKPVGSVISPIQIFPDKAVEPVFHVMNALKNKS